MESPPSASSASPSSSTFLGRHEFLIRRLHSLSGLVPVGAYMVVHLATNASVLDSPGTFQANVSNIHGLGAALPFVEWGFIFIPILFHAVLGVVFIKGGLPNNSTYRYANNYRYTLQRASGMIAFLFIMVHVFHMHGWFHIPAWERNVAEPLGGAQFRPYNAASSLGLAMSHIGWQAFYLIGVLSCVFHLANGIWTMGITWGLWISPAAQQRANWIALAFGLILTVISLSAFVGAVTVDIPAAKEIEDKKYEAGTASGTIRPNEHKRLTDEQKEKIEELSKEGEPVVGDADIP